MKTLRGSLAVKILAILLLCALAVVCVLSALGTAYLSDMDVYSLDLDQARKNALDNRAHSYLYSAGQNYQAGDVTPQYQNTNFRYRILSPEGVELISTWEEGAETLWEGSELIVPRYISWS